MNLTRGPIVTDADERISNVLSATLADITARRASGATEADLIDAQNAVWGLMGWLRARAALHRLRREYGGTNVQAIADAGLEVPDDD